jgi:hypothetical protein
MHIQIKLFSPILKTLKSMHSLLAWNCILNLLPPIWDVASFNLTPIHSQIYFYKGMNFKGTTWNNMKVMQLGNFWADVLNYFFSFISMHASCSTQDKHSFDISFVFIILLIFPHIYLTFHNQFDTPITHQKHQTPCMCYIQNSKYDKCDLDKSFHAF